MATGFLPSSSVERFLQNTRPDLREIALEVRNLVVTAAPAAAERILWGGLSYHDPAKGGPVKGAICQIEIRRGQVRVGFIHGVRIEDPLSLLQGKRLSKRFVPIEDFDSAPWQGVQDLIKRAAGLAPAAFDGLSPEPE
ncbi:MAG: DUF1801 domain-containing protein [Anaerolineales bacterium]